MYNILQKSSKAFDLYQINSQIGSQKSNTFAYHDSEDLEQFQNQETYQEEIKSQKVSEPISIKLKEQIRLQIYKNNIHPEDYIFIICTFLLHYNVVRILYILLSSLQTTSQRFSLDTITLQKILESVFQQSNDENIKKIIKQNEFKDYNQQQLQIMADLWFQVNKFVQDGEDIINYYDAFKFFDFVLKRYFLKFDAFLIFLVKRQQITRVRITSAIYQQIIQFFFSYQTDEYQKYKWNESPLIQEFLNQENQQIISTQSEKKVEI